MQAEECLRQTGKRGSLTIITKGSTVYIVAKAKKKANILVEVDNKQHRKVIVSSPRLYLIARLKNNKKHCLKLSSNRNLEAYSFAFE